MWTRTTRQRQRTHMASLCVFAPRARMTVRHPGRRPASSPCRLRAGRPGCWRVLTLPREGRDHAVARGRHGSDARLLAPVCVGRFVPLLMPDSQHPRIDPRPTQATGADLERRAAPCLRCTNATATRLAAAGLTLASRARREREREADDATWRWAAPGRSARAPCASKRTTRPSTVGLPLAFSWPV